MFIVTADEMRRMDRLTIESFGIPGIVLMENAGRSAAQMLLACDPDLEGRKAGIIAGKGNNGGDGFVIARYLAANGVDVVIYLLTHKEMACGDAAGNLRLAEKLDIPVIEIPDGTALAARMRDMDRCDLWVDAILGTGLKSDVRGHFAQAIDYLNRTGRPVFAVDIPSGLNSDTGAVCGVCVRAARTVTFGLPKIGHVVYPGAELVGDLAVVDIGIPRAVIDQVAPRHQIMLPFEMAAAIRPRLPETHKGRTGHLLVIGGAPGRTGAAAMTCLAAARAGAGLVTLGLSESLNHILEVKVTEAMTVPLPETADHTLGESAYEKIISLMERKRAVAIGPGLGMADETRVLVRRLVEKADIPMVVDADGLNALAGETGILARAKAPLILTPHPGEMARLLGTGAADVQKNRIGVARDFAVRYHVYLVLKGARTVIAEPDGMVSVNPTGNPGMASGGMGDVLTGMIAGLLAQGYVPADAARLGVYIHGAAADRLAAERGPVGYLAGDLIDILPEEIRAASESAPRRDGEIPLIERVMTS